MNYDLIVIGSGPGGYVAAVRGAQKGLKTAVVERENLGGICLNWGCIPTKALLKSAQAYNYARHAEAYGVKVADVQADLGAMVDRSRGVSATMNKGVEFLLKKNNVDVIHGTATLLPGGRVSVDMHQEESQKAGCVRLTYTVSDTGIGMSPEFMATMYQPFSRQTDSRVNSIQGTGLGLAITKQMVDLMEGTIDCQSEQGKGTTFTVILDLPVADRQREDMLLEPMDVLIVDDDEVLLETAVDTLESLGVTADCAKSGLEALGMIMHRNKIGQDYRVVILDWKMPDIDGVETIRRIRTEINSSIPILLISAYDWSDIEDVAKEAGANGFVSKPLLRSTLYDKINELLGTEAKSVEPDNDYSDLQGMNILIAEDNDINWEIISTMLGMFGITTERAKNGRICVEKMDAAMEGTYDLIFMDIQMPEMNGLDATRNIRALSDPWASSIPIIAMTADAFSENVTECLNAGMNGHIAKPIDIKLVIKEIRRIKEEKRA